MSTTELAPAPDRRHTILTTNSAHNLAAISPEDFGAEHIPAIAHALSLINRFTGHTSRPYSVAEHSVRCSVLVPEEFALEALLHDAHEAYLGDIAAPLKALLPDYQRLEAHVEAQLRAAYGLPATMSETVRRVDRHMLAVESAVLMPMAVAERDPDFCVPERLGWGWQEAREAFLHRFTHLIRRQAVTA